MSDDAVGYRKPPRATRFKTGVSGNPKGRPKGSKNHDTMLRRLLEERIQPEPLSWRRPRVRHILEQLVERALDGDWRALQMLLSMMQRFDTTAEPYDTPSDDDDFSEAVERFLRSTAKSSDVANRNTEDREDLDRYVYED